MLPFSSSRALRRTVTALGFSAVLLTIGSGSVAADERSWDVSGTVIAVNGPIVTLTTSDIIGRPQPIMIDVSWLRDLQVAPGEPLQLTIQARESNTYLARGIVRESPFVDREDFGVREQFTVQQDSIEAGVGNVPVDDEALAKQHRDHNLRQKEENQDTRQR